MTTPSRYIAMPKAFVDEQRHAYPIGPDQLDKFRKGDDEYGRTNYYTDPRALKLLSQDQWNQDRPLYDIQNPDLPVAKERRDYFVGSQRTLNYIRRMVPHIFGWFTMSSAWFIIIVRFTTQTCSQVQPPPAPPFLLHRRTWSGPRPTCRSSPTAPSPGGWMQPYTGR